MAPISQVMLHKLKNFVTTGLLLAFFVYLIFGAVIFHALESPAEEKMRIEFWEFKRNLSRRWQNSSQCFNSDESSPVVVLTQEELHGMLDLFFKAQSWGLHPDSTEEKSSRKRWGMDGALGISGALLTTIGYGHFSPVTTAGKAFCVAYATLGIPLTALTVSAIAERMRNFSRFLAKKISEKRPQWNRQWVERSCNASRVAVGMVVFFVIPTWMVHIVEDWTYGDSFYFVFITLSTVGFGDYVTGERIDREYSVNLVFYRVFILLWTGFGMAFLGMVFTMMSKALKKMSTKVHPTSEQSKTVTRERITSTSTCTTGSSVSTITA
ncbi:potassium channel subfamily K member 16-like [Branchiostoma floridae]|uniref:Potassium channel subfamily K member 16-like n=1 Tax=Branchiostoma floridae TaxID=7739 RepID=A0A9J7HGC6_BRAFL|nr:potassium channel subfamily K member 16-like [Branchiostoma floridae]